MSIGEPTPTSRKPGTPSWLRRLLSCAAPEVAMSSRPNHDGQDATSTIISDGQRGLTNKSPEEAVQSPEAVARRRERCVTINVGDQVAARDAHEVSLATENPELCSPDSVEDLMASAFGEHLLGNLPVAQVSRLQQLFDGSSQRLILLRVGVPVCQSSAEVDVDHLLCEYANAAALEYGSCDHHESLGHELCFQLQHQPGLLLILESLLRRCFDGHSACITQFIPNLFGLKEKLNEASFCSESLFLSSNTKQSWSVHEDGSWRESFAVMEVALCLVPADSGLCPGLLIMIKDVDSHDRALAAQLIRDCTTLGHIPSLVTVFSMDGRVLHQNGKSVSYLGYVRGRKRLQRHDINSPEHPLRQMFKLEPGVLDDMLSSLESGKTFHTRVRMPAHIDLDVQRQGKPPQADVMSTCGLSTTDSAVLGMPLLCLPSMTGTPRPLLELGATIKVGTTSRITERSEDSSGNSTTSTEGTLKLAISAEYAPRQTSMATHVSQNPFAIRSISSTVGPMDLYGNDDKVVMTSPLPACAAPFHSRPGQFAVLADRIKQASSTVGSCTGVGKPAVDRDPARLCKTVSFLGPDTCEGFGEEAIEDEFLMDSAPIYGPRSMSSICARSVSITSVKKKHIDRRPSFNHLPGASRALKLASDRKELRSFSTVNHSGAGEPTIEELAADAQERQQLWFEVQASQFMDPVSGQDVILLIQTDATAAVLAEQETQRILDAEHHLLEAVFPKHVLEVMFDRADHKQYGTQMIAPSKAESLARSHKSVTLLFADIVTFTDMCQQIPAHSVMSFLNNLFSQFDALLSKHGVYKVETIGDCYFISAGLICEDAEGTRYVDEEYVDPDAGRKVLAFARDMLAVAARTTLPTGQNKPVQIRIGIHTGPVVSGVVGASMPRFGLCGDSVNTASRMESTSQPGRIHVSAAAKEAIGDPKPPGGTWEPTGGTQVKGKGLMETFFFVPDTA